MIETMVLGVVGGWILIKIFGLLFDRPVSREQIAKEIAEQQKVWLNSAEFRRLNQERLNKLRP